ncbi:DNA-binding XRE family transcriptional regulator [Paenibacillus cellulosilyticus]|uniref:DNA-binding XRE family transcriptional regulator n=1 Tax=Paenibacillus cellulosilyticus TaxID=375489 RepID=A0A2V2Z3X8_9BACL|nr:helix-turn-helix transcriptional regulator [Paenibacillus cellulosilyticus]PWW08520.1 DNA-binding XRE family transcriptional regulator [Paenibacillus cellulosilyticus]QKS48099.1 helix-turn-helix transcriptional regulator [Paenibacillus cellulosilyticus]
MTVRELVIGNRISYIRKHRGITQKQLADALGIDRASLSQIETGRYSPRAETIRKLSDFFQLPIGDLFYNPSLPGDRDRLSSSLPPAAQQ